MKFLYKISANAQQFVKYFQVFNDGPSTPFYPHKQRVTIKALDINGSIPRREYEFPNKSLLSISKTFYL